MRDKYRHPVQTLEFLGIRPDMTVIEVLPGGGWYTEILAPFLRDHGQLIEASLASGRYDRLLSPERREYRPSSPRTQQSTARWNSTPFVLPDYM